MLNKMKARTLFDGREPISEDAFVELVLHEVPEPVIGSTRAYKYRLALVVDGACVLRYDNETGKGDHKHQGEKETIYHFSTVEKLVADFYHDVMRWLNEHGND